MLFPSFSLETDFEGRFALARRWPDGSGGIVVITAHGDVDPSWHDDVDPPWIVAVAGVVPGGDTLNDDDQSGWRRVEEPRCYLKAFQTLPDAFAVAFALLRLDAAERCRVLVQLGWADLAPEGRERDVIAEILAEQAARLDAFAAETAAMEASDDGTPSEVVIPPLGGRERSGTAMLYPSFSLETDFEGRFFLARQWFDGPGGIVGLSIEPSNEVDSHEMAVRVLVHGAVPGASVLREVELGDWSKQERDGKTVYANALPLPGAFSLAFSLLRADAADRCRILVQFGRADLATSEQERAVVAEILAEQAARLDAFAAETTAMEASGDGTPFEVFSLLFPSDPEDPFYADAAPAPDEPLDGEALRQARIRAIKWLALQRVRAEAGSAPPAGPSKRDRAKARKDARRRRRAGGSSAQ